MEGEYSITPEGNEYPKEGMGNGNDGKCNSSGMGNVSPKQRECDRRLREM